MNRAAAGILDAATRWRATAIAVGTHARTGLPRALIGSVADAVLRSAEVPVIVTRDGTDRDSLRRVIVGIDASEPSTSAGAFGVELGFEQRIRMVYCTVSDTTSLLQPNVDLPFDPTPVLSQMRCSSRDALDAALMTANEAGVYPDTDIIDASDVGAGLCAAAVRHDSDAIVVGKHKRGEIERFLIGSTANAVILAADRPVIVVPAHAKFASAQALVGAADGPRMRRAQRRGRAG
jgi:nucleotide-binding universal stress UspA family protein